MFKLNLIRVKNLAHLNKKPKPLLIRETRQLFIQTCYTQTDRVIQKQMSSGKSNIVRQGPLFRGLEVTLTLFRDFEGYEFTKLNAPLLASSGIGMSPAASKHFWLLFSRKTENPNDLVEAWCRVTSIVSKDMNTDEQQLDLISDLITRNIDKLDIFQLKQVFFSLTFLYAQYTRFSKFATLLDLRLSQLVQDIKISKGNIDPLLELSFIQLRMALLSVPHHFHLKSLYTTCLIDRLLVDHINKLKPEQLVFCIFLAGLFRQYPRLPYHKIPDAGFPLPVKLNKKLSEVLPKVGPLEAGIVCHGLHMCFLHFSSKDDRPLLQELYKKLEDFPDQNVQKHQFTISSISKILKNKGGVSKDCATRVVLKYQQHLQYSDAYLKLRLVQLFQSIFIETSARKSFLNELVLSLKEDDLKSWRLKDLEQLTFCLVFLNVDDSAAFTRISDAVSCCDWSDVRSGKCFVYIVSHLTLANIFNIQNIESILKEVNKCDISDLDTLTGLTNAIDFLFRLNIPLYAEAENAKLNVRNFIKRNRSIALNSLFHVLNIDFFCYVHGVALKETLKPEIRTGLIQYFQSQFRDRAEKRQTVKKLDTPSPKLNQRTFNDDNSSTMSYHQTLLLHIHRDLAILLKGSNSYSVIDFALPVSTSQQVIIKKKDEQTNPSVIRDGSWKSFLDSNSVNTDMVLIIPKKTEIVDNSELLGRASIEYDCLKRLGIPCGIIDWESYYNSLKEKRNLKFLRQIIRNR